ncbi:Protein fem-1-like protein C [Bienertia sinuspersici]
MPYNFVAKRALQKLSKEMQTFVYIQDFEGFTPVLRAVQYGRFGVARLLIQQCHYSIGIREKKGYYCSTPLEGFHVLPVWNNFYEHCHLDEIRITYNNKGNTALHSAIIDGDFNKVKFLMDRYLQSENKQELDILSNEGHTPGRRLDFSKRVYVCIAILLVQKYKEDNNLLRPKGVSFFVNMYVLFIMVLQKEFQQLVSKIYVKEREVMDENLYRAAINGDTENFKPSTNDDSTNDEESKPPNLIEAYFCGQTLGGSSIVHIALRHGKENVQQFIETALGKYPILSMRPDSNGGTPLHLHLNGRLVFH